MSETIRLTMAQAVARFLAAQMTEIDGERVPLFGGVWAIFGHGNVAGMGEALYSVREKLPTYRAHNEQGMAHAAIAFAKASFRRRMMACTSSIGPGATNMVTAAALAHVNRLPVLFLPGDVFANRRPDPVLQQVEDFADGTVSANDCFKPVSRYFDRITRPEQIMPALRRAMQVLTDPADCGPVTLALCQDTQAEAYDYPARFFAETVHTQRRVRPDADELARAVAAIKGAKQPVLIAGGGVLYSGASDALERFADAHDIPVMETQAGKSALPHSHRLNMGSVGVTGTSAANGLAEQADVIVAVGTRLADFTTGSWALFENPDAKFVALNVASVDAGKHGAMPLLADARVGLDMLGEELGPWRAPEGWRGEAEERKRKWLGEAEAATAATNAPLPSDAQVIGATQRMMGEAIVVCAAGGLPGELHKLWKPEEPGRYHLEYGYSTMGYEIAGGLGVKLARPADEVVVMVGDGSYMMANSELSTAVMMGLRLTVVVLDNRGFGCINRLQMATGGENFNNLFEDVHKDAMPEIDFTGHASALGAHAQKVAGISELEAALAEARKRGGVNVVVIDTDPLVTTEAGGHWWDVAVPEVSERADVRAKRAEYEERIKGQRIG